MFARYTLDIKIVVSCVYIAHIQFFLSAIFLFSFLGLLNHVIVRFKKKCTYNRDTIFVVLQNFTYFADNYALIPIDTYVTLYKQKIKQKYIFSEINSRVGYYYRCYPLCAYVYKRYTKRYPSIKLILFAKFHFITFLYIV